MTSTVQLIRFAAAAVAVGVTALVGAAPAGAVPYVHAHRGGPLMTKSGELQPAFPEASMPAFRDAARRGFVLELDVKLASDGVPLVIHDATLDRTTTCEGLVVERPATEIRRDCPIDVVGTGDTTAALTPVRGRPVRVPPLRQVLRFALRRGLELNLEIKNVPTDPDFDPTDAFARRVAAEIKRSGFPPSRLIVQSFSPANLDVIERDPHFRLAETSLLSLAATNDGGPAFADANGYEWISPQWPVSASFVSEAHSRGLRVVPWTLDRPEDVLAATRLGVDAVISNDPRMARNAVHAASPPRPRIPPPPSDAECAATHASRTVTPIMAPARGRRAPRVFALQFKQEIRHVETYETFRAKIECMVRHWVVPRMAKRRPNIVALTEDIGLMTLATGSRGAGAREIAGDPERAPSCEEQGVPCGVAAAIGALQVGYSGEIAAYRQRFDDMGAVEATFVAGTDTFARGWMQVFSDMARRYDVHILGSNTQAPFRESTDPAEIEAFADPDLPRPRSVFVATTPRVYNEAFMWGPRDVRREGPAPLRNMVSQNKKVPVTEIEETIEVSNGPVSGPDAVENLRPYRVPKTRARIGFATSKPAFVYNGTATEGFGETLAPGLDPCSDVRLYYMRCLDALGTNVVMQDEANPGRWPAASGEGHWQPLVWLSSTWRAVADPTVSFKYNVTPHMVGNLADLPFDGQTSITQSGLRGPRGRKRCTYVGNQPFQPAPPESDGEYLRVYAGGKREFVGIAPWVIPDAPRDELRDVGRRLAPGSGDATENGYLETAIVADLPFPPDPRRSNCNGSSKRR